MINVISHLAQRDTNVAGYGQPFQFTRHCKEFKGEQRLEVDIESCNDNPEINPGCS